MYYYYGINVAKTIRGVVFSGPNAILVVHVDPLGIRIYLTLQFSTLHPKGDINYLCLVLFSGGRI